MNLLDYVSTTHVKIAKLEYDGQQLDFFYKDLTGAEGEQVTEKIGSVLAMVAKQKKDVEYMPTGDELKDMNLMRDYTLWLQICDQSGARLFETMDEMKNKIPAKLLDIASKAIQKTVTTEDAEKNLKSLSGSAGYSDLQTAKTPALATSSTPTAKTS